MKIFDTVSAMVSQGTILFYHRNLYRTKMRTVWYAAVFAYRMVAVFD